MFSSKSALLAQSLLFFASYASCQGGAAPNGTLYIPGVAQLASVLGAPTAAIVASQVSVDGVSTVFKIVDTLPTGIIDSPPLTATLVISPTGAHLSSDGSPDGISNVVVDCAIAGASASCQLEAQAGDIAESTSFTEATSGVPVVALGFATTSGASASGSASGSSATGSASTVPVSSSSSSGPSGITVPLSSSASTPTSGSTSNSASASSGSSIVSTASSTAPASSASPSPTQPSSATNVHVSMGSVLFGLVVVAFSLATL